MTKVSLATLSGGLVLVGAFAWTGCAVDAGESEREASVKSFALSAPNVVVADLGDLRGVASSGTAIVWTTSMGVQTIPTTGGTATTLGGGGKRGGAGPVATDGTNAYWVENNGIAPPASLCGSCGRIYMLPLATPSVSPTLLAERPGGPDGPVMSLATDGAHVYWAEYGALGGVYRMPIGGGSAQRLAAAPGLKGVSVDGTSVYWHSKYAGIYKADKSSGANPVQIVVDGPRLSQLPGWLALSGAGSRQGSRLYWGEVGTPGTIFELRNGINTTLVSNVRALNLNGIAWNPGASTLYWAEPSSGTPNTVDFVSARIMSLAVDPEPQAVSGGDDFDCPDSPTAIGANWTQQASPTPAGVINGELRCNGPLFAFHNVAPPMNDVPVRGTWKGDYFTPGLSNADGSGVALMTPDLKDMYYIQITNIDTSRSYITQKRVQLWKKHLNFGSTLLGEYQPAEVPLAEHVYTLSMTAESGNAGKDRRIKVFRNDDPVAKITYFDNGATPAAGTVISGAVPGMRCGAQARWDSFAWDGVPVSAPFASAVQLDQTALVTQTRGVQLCQPKTCTGLDLVTSCGTADDGCGNKITCGCASGYSCRQQQCVIRGAASH